MEHDCSSAKRKNISRENHVDHSESNKVQNTEDRSIEYDCSPAKRRNISREKHVDHSESNKVQNTEEISNTEVVVKDRCALNNGKGSLLEGAQIDCRDFEQENNKSKFEIVVEESKLDATEASLIEGIQIDGCNFEQENNKSKDKIVMKESKLDATKANDNRTKNEDNSCGDNVHSQFTKKLLVLDVNGLLADIVADPDESYKPDTIIGTKAVFKRPFCDEFLKFCFERFNVGVWTSRTRRNIERVLKFLGINTQQLLFCWDQFHCTKTGFNTIENSDKPLLLKELKKLWEKKDPKLPWDKGVYNESNTIFLDDSPYKALRNPPYTAIFPYSYSYHDTEDIGLGPNGDLRSYLEKLAECDNVQKFIEQNPFGQQPITYNDESWYFYRKIIGPTEPKAGPSRSRRKLIIIEAGGLLVDIATIPREGFKADTMQGSRGVFKRPYCDEFLQFCFKRFNVGLWSSTTRYNMEWTFDFLMGDSPQKFLFSWDVSHCTNTGFSTVENSCKTIILKEVRKLWEKKDPNLPWEIGEYDESNTLLVENTPHKALLNPPHTAIFPYPYRYWYTEDNSLGPKGDLRIYLERLAASENVQKFVSENPFGQRPITEKNLSWGYYKRVIDAFPSKSKAHANGPVNAQCKNSSEPKLKSTIVLAAPTLSEPKAESTTVLAAPNILEPKADSTTVLAAPTLLETKTESTTVSATPTLLEPKAESITVSAAPTILEPKADSSTVSAAPTLLEPKAESSTVSAAPTLLEPKADSCTVSAAPTLLEPKAESTNVSAAPTILKPETDTTSDAQTLLKPETNNTSVLVDPTSLKL